MNTGPDFFLCVSNNILHVLGSKQRRQILCKCIISYHTIAVRSSKLLFFIFTPGVNGLAGVGCYLHAGN
jgi:hypothetical protein